eukprot:13191756-Ditylum_brightwellii.AAC.1
MAMAMATTVMTRGGMLMMAAVTKVMVATKAIIRMKAMKMAVAIMVMVLVPGYHQQAMTNSMA